MAEDLTKLTDEELDAEIEKADAISKDFTKQRSEIKENALINQKYQDALKEEYLRRNPPNPTGSIGG